MRYRFGPYELDTDAGALSRSGHEVHLTRQPLRLLALLVESAGDIVTREAIEQSLWGHPFVEADQGINQCVRQVRVALQDDPKRPLFVETLPRRGYRFIAPVTALDPPERGSAAVVGAPKKVVAGVVVLALAALAVLFARPASHEADASEAVSTPVLLSLAQAEAYLDRRQVGLVAEAVDGLSRLAEEHPDNADIFVRLAVAGSTLYWYSGSTEPYELARKSLERGKELGSDPSSLRLAEGVLALHARRYDEALAAFLAARDLSEPDALPEVDMMLGKTLRRMGRWEDAQRAFERAFEERPTSFEISYGLAATARFRRDFETARRFLEHANTLDQDHWVTWAIRPVDALRESGDTALARRLAMESIERIGRETLFGTSQALARVLPDLAIGGEGGHDGQTVFRGGYELSLAEAYRTLGREEQARAHYESAVSLLSATVDEGLWPESYRGEPLGLLAMAEAGLGRRERALERVEEAVLVLPVAQDALAGVRLRHHLARALLRLGEHERALDFLEYLLDHPSAVTPALLRVDPIWDPVRDNPRFRDLLLRARP